MKREFIGSEITWFMEVVGLDMCLRNWGFSDVREWMLGIKVVVIMDSKEKK